MKGSLLLKLTIVPLPIPSELRAFLCMSGLLVFIWVTCSIGHAEAVPAMSNSLYFQCAFQSRSSI